MYIENTKNPILQHQNGKTKSSEPMPSIWLSKRFLVAIILFVGFANSIVLLCNINIAMIEMTSDKSIILGNLTITRPPDFQWDPATVGLISSMHSYAGLFPFLGSYLAHKLGGSTSSVVCLIAGGILTILHEATLYINLYSFLICRFLVGLSMTSYTVTTAELFSRWYPKTEKSTLITVSYSGTNLGPIMTYPLYGYVAHCWGWQMVFYVSGTISLIIASLVLIIVRNHPSEDARISKQELLYILSETNTSSRTKVNHPYKKILSSGPIIALSIAKFSFSWTENLICESMPSYVKDITKQETNITGSLSTIPIIAPLVVYPTSGILLDYWKNHAKIDLTRIHKLVIVGCCVTMSILFFALIIIPNFTISMAIFTLIEISISVMSPVVDFLSIHLAPNDSSIIAGLMATSMSVSFIISRTVAGLLTLNHSLRDWNNFFVISDIVLISGTSIFLRYGSSEIQSWSLPEDDEERRYLMENDERTSYIAPFF